MCQRIEHIIEVESFAMLEVDGHAICYMYRICLRLKLVLIFCSETQAHISSRFFDYYIFCDLFLL